MSGRSNAGGVERVQGAGIAAVDRLLATWHGARRVARRRAWLARAPHGAPRTWAVRDAEGEVLATTAMFPRRFVVAGREVTGALGGDAFVHPEARRRGLARRLHAATREDMGARGLAFMYGPPRAQNLKALLAAGARAVGEVRFYHRPLDRFGVEALLGHLAWLKAPLRRLLARAAGLALRRAPGCRAAPLREVSAPDPRFDALFARARRWHRVTGVRDAAWVRWRFREAHVPARLWILESEGELRGWAAVLPMGQRLVVLDLLAAAPGDLRPLLAGVLAGARREGFHSVGTRLNPRTAYARAARRLGFLCGRTRSVFQVLGRDLPDALLDARGWHLTYGDEDVEDWPAWFEAPPRIAAPSRRRPKKVVFLMDIFVDTHGGTEGQVATLLSNLPRGWKAELWVLQQSAFVRAGGLPCPTRELRLPRVRDPRFFPRILSLASTLRREGVDLIQGFHSDTCTLAPVLGALAGIPVVTARRDFGYWQTPRVLELLRRANRLASRIVCNAAAVAARTIEVEQAHPDQVRHVPNGHPPARFEVARDPGFRRRHGLPSGARLLGLVANYRKLKRQEDLVRALAQLGGRHAEVHAVFVGEGEGWRSLFDLARELGVGDRVHHPDCHTEVLPLLRELSVGVLCSESEGLSNAIIEYMAMGLPVVASAVGGNPELVREGETGHLFPTGNVQELAEALTRLLDDPERGARMGRAGRARYEAEYTVDRMVARTTRVWEEALAARAAPPETALHVQVLQRVEDLHPLASSWEALLGPLDVFLGPDWVITWFEHRRAAPFVLVAREGDGRLVGLWPLARVGRRLVAAGQDMGSDHLDVLAEGGRGDAVMAAFFARLRQASWSSIEVAHVRERGVLRGWLRRGGSGACYHERLATVCPYVRTGGRGFAAFLQERFRSKPRGRLRKGVAAFRALPGAQVLRAGEDGLPVEAAVDRLFDLHEARAGELGRRSSFARPGARVFHRALARRLAARGRLHLLLLRTEAGDLAVDYGFRFGGRLVAFQSGMREHEAIASPGQVLNAIVLEEEVFAAGLDEYDFLDGDEPYKLRFADGERRLFDLRILAPGPWARLRLLAGGALRLLRAELKRLYRGRR